MDYNIYIHTVGGESAPSSPTTPWQVQNTSGIADRGVGGFGGDNFNVKMSPEFLGVDNNSETGQALTSKAGALAKAAVIVAIYKAFQITKQAAQFQIDLRETSTGDYSVSNLMNNVKAFISDVTHPIQTAFNARITQKQIFINNLKDRQQMELLGGTIYHAPYGRYL